jgi:glycosyltransferase involved in cell wall biosynthesis
VLRRRESLFFLGDLVKEPCPTRVAFASSVEKLNLLFVTGSVSTKSSGPYLSLLQTAQQLRRCGHGITVLGTRELREKGAPPEWREFNAKVFPKIGPGTLHFGLGVRRWLREQHPKADVMSLEGVWLHIGADVAQWCLENRTPYVITAHGNFNPVALAISSWKKRIAVGTFARRLLAKASCYHALNEAEYRAIRNYGLSQPVFVVPNGIEMPETNGLAAGQIPQENQARRTCLYLGRLHPIKGLDRLLRAWASVRPGSEWQLVIAGGDTDGYRSKLESIVREQGMREYVRFVGFLDGDLKAAWLRQAEFFVLPSNSEGLPMAALEALSYGTAVLLTEACNLREAESAGAALVVPSSTEGIRDGLAEMTSKSRAELMEMGDRGRCFAAREYDWNVICAKLEGVYRWMAGKGDMPECVRVD